MDQYSLSEDQMEKLNEGEKVKVTKHHSSAQITIFPPCDTHGHEWTGYSIKQMNKEEITRRCKRCGTTEKTDFDPEEVFGDE